MSTRKQTKGFLIGVLAGGVVGSITALLLAPKAGKELRQDIAVGATKVQETTVKVAGQVGDTTGRFAKQIGEQAVNIADKAKNAAGSVVASVKNWRSDNGVEDTIADEDIIITASDSDEDETAGIATEEEQQLQTMS